MIGLYDGTDLHARLGAARAPRLLGHSHQQLQGFLQIVHGAALAAHARVAAELGAQAERGGKVAVAARLLGPRVAHLLEQGYGLDSAAQQRQ
jgi:hypothetical protein